jgi:hypothetical protein
VSAQIPLRYRPVEVRLIGEPEAVAALVTVLTAATDVETVTAPIRARTPGLVRVYVTTTRRFPYSGGAK